MSSLLYGSFSLKEAHQVGRIFTVRCTATYGYEYDLTLDKEYRITITSCILPLSPLCSFIGDRGKKCECSLQRFIKSE